jgi:hypothetical protein
MFDTDSNAYEEEDRGKKWMEVMRMKKNNHVSFEVVAVM